MNARSGLNKSTRRDGWIPQGICVNTATTLERLEDPTTCAGNVKMVFSFLAGSRPVLFPTMELNVNPNERRDTMEISVTYAAVDGYYTTKLYKTLRGARKFAQDMVGKHPDMSGFDYCVSFDGVGRIRVFGCTLDELFPGKEE